MDNRREGIKFQRKHFERSDGNRMTRGINKKRTTWLLIAFFMVFVFAPVNYAAAYTATNAADELANIYKYIDENDKDSIRAAKTEALALSDTELDGLTNDLVAALPEEFLDQYPGDLQAELRDCFRDLVLIVYDENTVEDDLTEYKNNHKDTFQNLFGTSFTVDDLYELILALREELPRVIYNNSDYTLVVESGSDADLIAQIPNIAKDAADNVIANTEFAAKLGEIGWDTEMLMDTYIGICDAIDNPDPGSSAELALAKAAVRSQIYLYLCDADENIIGEIEADELGQRTITVQQPAYFQAYIGSQNTASPNSKANVTTWFLWDSNNDQVLIDVYYPDNKGTTLKLTSSVTGVTGSITGYRDADEIGNPDTDWILKFDVTVEGDETVKGYATWYKESDNAGITVTAKEGETVIAETETDADGLFLLALPDGIYTLELTVDGYLKTIIQNVEIVDGELVEVSTAEEPIQMSAGDINGDGNVTITDLGLLANTYGTESGQENYNSLADFNADQKVTISDLGYLANHYGETNMIINFD